MTQAQFATSAILGAWLVLTILVLIAIVLVLWMAARACAAWTVAIGQAQQLSLLGVATREEIDMRRGGTMQGEDLEEPPNAEARMELLERYSASDLMAAARKNAGDAGRRQGPPPQRHGKEFNANDNAQMPDDDAFEPETAAAK